MSITKANFPKPEIITAEFISYPDVFDTQVYGFKQRFSHLNVDSPTFIEIHKTSTDFNSHTQIGFLHPHQNDLTFLVCGSVKITLFLPTQAVENYEVFIQELESKINELHEQLPKKTHFGLEDLGLENAQWHKWEFNLSQNHLKQALLIPAGYLHLLLNNQSTSSSLVINSALTTPDRNSGDYFAYQFTPQDLQIKSNIVI